MARKPVPGSDAGTWGALLNDFLDVALDVDGNIKSGSVGESQLDTAVRAKMNAVSSGTLADGSVTTQMLATEAVTDAKLAAGIDQAKISGLGSALAGKLNTALAGSASGVATLGTDGKIPSVQLPQMIVADGSVGVSKLSAGTAISGQVLSTDGSNLTWSTPTASGSVSDASTTGKGIIQLAGDLTGTAGSPTIADGVVTDSKIASGIAQSKIDGLTSALSAKAATTHTHTSAQVTDFSSTVGSLVGSSIVAGANVSVSYNSANNLTTIAAASGGSGEAVDSVNAQTGVVVLDQDDISDGTTYKQYSSAEKTKLATVATSATANSSDTALLARANHTGTQLASTISDFDEAVEDKIGAKIAGGTDITVSYNDSTGTTTIASTASGGSGSSAIGVVIIAAGQTEPPSGTASGTIVLREVA